VGRFLIPGGVTLESSIPWAHSLHAAQANAWRLRGVRWGDPLPNYV